MPPKKRDRYADLKRDLKEIAEGPPPPKPKRKPPPPWIQRRRFRRVNPMPANCPRPKCGKPISWCFNEPNRARVPLDPEPNPEGRWVKVRLEFSEPDGTGKKYKIVRRLGRDEQPPAGHGTYTSHFDTCADPKPKGTK